MSSSLSTAGGESSRSGLSGECPRKSQRPCYDVHLYSPSIQASWRLHHTLCFHIPQIRKSIPDFSQKCQQLALVPSVTATAAAPPSKCLHLPKKYTLHSGSSSITTYNDTTTQSGQPLARSFCSICVSKLAARTPLNDDIISIPAGVLSSGNSGLGRIAKSEGADRRGVRWKPHKEQFCQEKAPWMADLGELVADERYVRGPFSEKVEDSNGGSERL